MRATKKGISGMLVLCLMLVGLLMPTQAMAASNSGTDGEIKWEVSETQGLWETHTTLTLSPVEGTQGRMKAYSSAESTPWHDYLMDKVVINEGITRITANTLAINPLVKVAFPKSIEKIDLDVFSISEPTIVYGYQGSCVETFVADLRKVQENHPSFDPKINYLTSFIPLDAPFAPPATTATVTATPTSSKVFVSGVTATSTDKTYEKVDAYTINGNNYFKLRDVAKMLVGSGWDFDVTWDNEKKAVNIVSDKAYTEVGGELARGDGKAKTAVSSTASIFCDGLPITLTAYTINGNTYVKLRDLQYHFSFGVDWDATTNTIGIGGMG